MLQFVQFVGGSSWAFHLAVVGPDWGLSDMTFSGSLDKVACVAETSTMMGWSCHIAVAAESWCWHEMLHGVGLQDTTPPQTALGICQYPCCAENKKIAIALSALCLQALPVLKTLVPRVMVVVVAVVEGDVNAALKSGR